MNCPPRGKRSSLPRHVRLPKSAAMAAIRRFLLVFPSMPLKAAAMDSQTCQNRAHSNGLIASSAEKSVPARRDDRGIALFLPSLAFSEPGSRNTVTRLAFAPTTFGFRFLFRPNFPVHGQPPRSACGNRPIRENEIFPDPYSHFLDMNSNLLLLFMHFASCCNCFTLECLSRKPIDATFRYRAWLSPMNTTLHTEH
jgi:hypothetical protein